MDCIKKWLFLLTTLVIFAAQTGYADESAPAQVTLVAENNSIQPGQPFWVAVQIKLDPHWHAYWKNPGESGMPVQIDWDLPDHMTVSDLEWPYPEKMEIGGIIGFGYDNELILLAKMTPGQNVDLSQRITIGAKARWLTCSNTECLPGNAKLALSLPISNEAPSLNTTELALFARARGNLPELPKAVLVSRDNDKLNLSVNLEHLVGVSDNVKFEFYPEIKKIIDLHHEEGSLSADGTMELSLKEIKKSTSLKGILVAKQGDTRRAFHINAPVQLDSEIAIADVKSTAKNAATGLESEVNTFWMAVFLAFIGGVILNLMPCVLPVISIKVLSFVKMARETRATTIKHGLAFSFGVIASFWVLAGLLLILKTYGISKGWGFQLQEPIFVGILAGLMFLLSLSLMGLFELGMSLSSWAGQVEHSMKKEAPEGLFTSFCSGILATVLATPCTGPFLGSVTGFAFKLPSYQTLLIFTSLGFGMASPYLLLGLFPSLLRFMPKPGAWMETFKQLMGFIVMASVLWLIWVFAAQTSEYAVFSLLIALYLLGIAGWVYGKWGTPARSRKCRISGSIIAAALLIGSIQIIHIASNSPQNTITKGGEIAVGDWEPYSAKRIAELQKAGTPVIVDFTAKWCLICQSNHMVLSTDDVSDKLDALGVVRMKADWTRNDPEITEALNQFGRNSVPLYLIYGADENEPPTILPQVLTPDIVLEELEKIPNAEAESETV